MTKLVIILLLFLFDYSAQQVQTGDVQCPINYTSTNVMKRLKKEVFCSYDRMIRPVRNVNDTVNVSLGIVLRRIDFDEKSDKLTVRVWLMMEWKDYHISWDPSKFNNVKTLNVMDYNLWFPDIALYTSYDDTSILNNIGRTICIISFNGKVWCVPPHDLQSRCSADITRWPYDIHKCKIEMGSWTRTEERLNTSLYKTSVHLEDYNMNREWEMISLLYSNGSRRFCCPKYVYTTATFEFTLQRHSGIYVATVVLPAVILMLVTLVTFWMKANEPERLIIVTTDMLSHIIFLLHLGNILPTNSDNTPFVVLFYQDSMCVTMMALLTTLIVRSLRNKVTSIPLWTSSIIMWIMQNHFGQVLLISQSDNKNSVVAVKTSDEDVEPKDEAQPRATWHTFAILIDFVCFAMSLFLYLILLLKFII